MQRQTAMARRSGRTFLSMVVLVACVAASCQAQATVSPQLPEISEELTAMRDEDQKYRRKWSKLVKKGKTETKKYRQTTEKLVAIDRRNTDRMREIVAQHGWPTYDLVGKRASNHAWILVQHADRNPLVQMQCLPLLKEAVDNGQANPSNYAYLYDRVQVALGEKQLYATQSTTNNGLKQGFFQALEDESNVQRRRSEMGIDLHIETYAQQLGFDYTVPSPEEAIKRDRAGAQAYAKNSLLAQEAMAAKDYAAAVEHYSKALESFGYIETKDYVDYARALSLSHHERCRVGYYYLIKAAVRGHEAIDTFDTHSDFQNLKEAAGDNWQDLMRVVKELRGSDF